jgi:hypothetical protein
MSNFVLDPRNSSDQLRPQDRYVRAVLRAVPEPPRSDFDRWYPARNSFYISGLVMVLAMGIGLVILLPYIVSLIEAGVFWQTRNGVLLTVGLPFYLYFCTTFIWQLYAWRTALHAGRRATARVHYVSSRSAYGTRGVWEVHLPSQSFEVKFNEASQDHSSWVHHLQEGDLINVLVHPVRNRVLVAYGP